MASGKRSMARTPSARARRGIATSTAHAYAYGQLQLLTGSRKSSGSLGSTAYHYHRLPLAPTNQQQHVRGFLQPVVLLPTYLTCHLRFSAAPPMPLS